MALVLLTAQADSLAQLQAAAAILTQHVAGSDRLQVMRATSAIRMQLLVMDIARKLRAQMCCCSTDAVQPLTDRCHAQGRPSWKPPAASTFC